MGLRASLVLGVMAVLAACGGASHGLDAGPDAGARLDARPSRDVGIDTGRCSDPGSPREGCPCTNEGQHDCRLGGGGYVCCRGVFNAFMDGPCDTREPDGAVPTCDYPRPGCSCAGEGARECSIRYGEMFCRAGVWERHAGFMCC